MPGDDGSFHPGRHPLLVLSLAVTLFLSIAALAAFQATSATPATNALSAEIATLTDVNGLLAEDMPLLRQQAATTRNQAFDLPAFPVKVELTRREVTTLSLPALRTVVLERASQQAYVHGVGAFAQAGQQSFNRLSPGSLLTTVAFELTRPNHTRASLGLTALGALTVLAAAALVAGARPGDRIRLVGIALAVAGLAGALLAGAAWFGLGQLGGNTGFDAAQRSIARAIVSVPFRDFTIVALLGVVIVAAGPLIGLATRRLDGRHEPDSFGTEPEHVDYDDFDEDEEVGAGI